MGPLGLGLGESLSSSVLVREIEKKNTQKRSDVKERRKDGDRRKCLNARQDPHEKAI